MRVVAVDIGVKNVGIVALHFFSPLEEATDHEVARDVNKRRRVCRNPVTRTPGWSVVVEKLRECVVERWTVSALDDHKPPHERGSTPSATACLLESVVGLMRTFEETFATSNFVVLEQQMSPQMRVVAGALFAALRSRFPSLPIVLQSSKSKLAWNLDDWPEAARTIRTDTYQHRKSASVKLCGALLDGAERPDLLTIWRAGGKKRDDLADSLLHGLHFACSGRAEDMVAVRRRSSSTSDVSHCGQDEAKIAGGVAGTLQDQRLVGSEAKSQDASLHRLNEEVEKVRREFADVLGVEHVQ